MNPTLLGITVVLGLAIVALIVQNLLRKRPLIIKKVLALSTSGDLPNYPTEVALCLQCGMMAGEGGETLALINSGEQAKILKSAEQINLPEERKKSALGIMLLFNTDRPLKYPPQTVTLNALDYDGQEVNVKINLPEVTGRDGEHAFFYVDKTGYAYHANDKHQRAAAPNLHANEGMKKMHLA